MALPLLAVALTDLASTRSNSVHDLREAANDEEEENEIQNGVDEDEEFRNGLEKELQALRLSRSNSKGSGVGTSWGCLTKHPKISGPSPQGLQRQITHPSRAHSTPHEPDEANVIITPAESPSDPDAASQAPSTNAPALWRRIGRFLFGSREGGDVGPKEGDPDYVYPKYRWTPIFSGIVIPFSILLEIPSLTEPWYVRQVDGVAIVYQENPVLLDVGLAISMACAVVANIALITRFLERRVFWSTILCIVMLSIHDITNIVALIIFGIIHGVDDGFDYSVAFWMCVCSTTASFFTNITLIYDIIRTKQFRYSGSGLTAKQRKLVIVVMVLLAYIALGALVFNYLIADITFQNALYFTVATVETIGFGDISPSFGARIFLFFYMPLGILSLALAVGTARDMLVESWSAAYRRRRHNVIKRQRERKQQRAEETARLVAAARHLEEVDVLEKDSGPSGASQLRQSGKKLLHHIKDLKPSRKSDRSVSTASAEGSGGSQAGENERPGEDRIQYREALAELCLENEEGYKLFQERMKHEEKIEMIWKFGSAGGLFVVFWLVGAGIFTRTEDAFNFFDALYFCFVTFTTIGYGDVTVTSPAGRAVFIIWAICGVGIVTLLLAAIAEAYSNRYHAALTRRDRKLQSAKVDKADGVAAPEKKHLTAEDIEQLPHEILDLLKEWQTHLRVVKLCASGGGAQSMEAQIMIDESLFVKGEGDVDVKEMSPEGRRELYWKRYEHGIHHLIHLAEQSIEQAKPLSPNLSTISGLSGDLQAHNPNAFKRRQSL